MCGVREPHTRCGNRPPSRCNSDGSIAAAPHLIDPSRILDPFCCDLYQLMPPDRPLQLFSTGRLFTTSARTGPAVGAARGETVGALLFCMSPRQLNVQDLRVRILSENHWTPF